MLMSQKSNNGEKRNWGKAGLEDGNRMGRIEKVRRGEKDMEGDKSTGTKEKERMRKG